MSEKVDLLEVLCVGARLAPEESRALPQHYYGDPIKIVKFESEKCSNCVYSRPGKNGQFCSRGKQYGARCEQYKKAKGAK